MLSLIPLASTRGTMWGGQSWRDSGEKEATNAKGIRNSQRYEISGSLMCFIKLQFQFFPTVKYLNKSMYSEIYSHLHAVFQMSISIVITL